jgi:hypothetical protein
MVGPLNHQFKVNDLGDAGGDRVQRVVKKGLNPHLRFTR